jgi:hypothetical protein
MGRQGLPRGAMKVARDLAAHAPDHIPAHDDLDISAIGKGRLLGQVSLLKKYGARRMKLFRGGNNST